MVFQRQPTEEQQQIQLATLYALQDGDRQWSLNDLADATAVANLPGLNVFQPLAYQYQAEKAGWL